MIARIYLSLIVSVAVLLCSCASPQYRKAEGGHIIQNVPFYAQEEYQCGPASMAGVLNFWGAGTTPEEIAAAVFSKSARGTLTLDMVLYPGKKGYKARQYRGSLEDLKAQLGQGRPVIVLVDYGFLSASVDHYMVVIGYNDQGVVVNSGRSEKVVIEYDEFLRTWKRANNWTLVITPQQ